MHRTSLIQRKASKMQLKAIMHGEGPARVLAGPGSGKTFTIIQRIHYLIDHDHISPDKILCVTFTKAAALEMEQRFYHDFPQTADENNKKVRFATLHSLCYQILRESGDFYQYSLVSETTKRNIIKQLLANEDIMQDADYDMISDLLSCISKRKNISDAKAPVYLTREQFEKLFFTYDAMLKERQLLDFDDMISLACSLVQNDQFLLRKWQAVYTHVLVDEFQDMNENQYKIVRILSEPEKNLFIVGDDDQSIYGFRGAVPGIMKQFAEDYQEMTQLFLSENYRSGKEIVSLASEMIRENKDRLFKNPIPIKKGGQINVFFGETRRSEEQLLLAHLKQLSYQQLIESAVILRTNREVFQYAALLKEANIPIKQRKKEDNDYLHHFIMEDICGFIRFLKEGWRREDFLKFMNKPERYLARQPLLKEVVTEETLLRYYQKNREMCQRIHSFFVQLQKAQEMPPFLAIRYFRQVMGYDAYLEETAKTVQEKEKWLENIRKIQELFREMKPGETVDGFFRKKERECSVIKEEKIVETKGVSVITMHGAKGLEFTHVFLPDLNEGVIPGRTCKSKESIEEERRLLYVAITRAKEFLYLYYTRERNRKPTRFLKDFLMDNS